MAPGDKMFEYNDVGNKSQPEVKEAIDRFHKLSDKEKAKQPLLYWLLQDSTPKFKISKKDSKYTDKSEIPQKCQNCKFLYFKPSNERYICSQIAGLISPEGWCDRWKAGENYKEEK